MVLVNFDFDGKKEIIGLKIRIFMIRKNMRFWESFGQIKILPQTVIVALFLLILCLVGCGKPTESKSEKFDFSEKIKHYEELAYKFAPIYVQAFKSKYDIPTNFDFDRDFIGNNCPVAIIFYF